VPRSGNLNLARRFNAGKNSATRRAPIRIGIESISQKTGSRTSCPPAGERGALRRTRCPRSVSEDRRTCSELAEVWAT